MRVALPRLKKRLAELRALEPQAVQRRGDPAFKKAQLKADSTLVDIFGADSVEYGQFRVRTLDTAAIYMGHPSPLVEIRNGYSRGRDQAVTKLQAVLDLFEEKLAAQGETPSGRARRAIGELDLHSEIERAAGPLFRSGHYANAIEDGCKALDLLVQMRSKKSGVSGTDLMTSVFSAKAPLLRFNDGKSESDRSEQQGMMHLFAGSMLAFRNPRAHGLVTDDPETTLEILSFLSFLARAADRAKLD